MVEPLGDARADPRDDVLRNLGLGRARREPDVPERLSEEELHREEEPLRSPGALLRLVFAELVHLHDVRVRQARRDAGLVEEHVGEVLVARELGLDDLDGVELLEPRRPREAADVDVRHAAIRELCAYLVAPNLRGESRRSCHNPREYNIMIGCLFDVLALDVDRGAPA